MSWQRGSYFEMLRKKLKSPPIWLWVIGITLVIALLLGAVAWYINRKWKPILDTQLKQLVINATDSLYRVDYSYLNLNVVTGNAIIKDFKLIPNKQVYEKLVREQKAPDNLYDLQVNNLLIKNFHPKLLYSQKKLLINRIVIDRPRLFITNRRQPYNDTIPLNKPRSLYQAISKVFKEIRVNQILLNHINFTFDNRSHRVAKKTSIKDLDIAADDLFIDSLSENDPKRFYHTRNVNVYLDHYEIATADGLYDLSFKDFFFSTSSRKLVIGKMSLDPRYSKAEFYQKLGYDKDRYNLDFNRIAIHRIDLHRFLRDQKLYAGLLSVANSSIDVFNNKAYPKPIENKTGKFPHQQLQKLALDLKIDTLHVRKASIGYSEFNPNSKETGKIYFNKTEATFYNVTNDSAALKNNQLMLADITSRFMNSAPLEVHFRFNLARPDGSFSYSGNLQDLDGKVLNNITKPLGLLEIKSAKVKKLAFNVKANSKVARGTMQFYYNDLSVNILKKDNEGKLKKSGLISGVANVFVIHEDNPGINGKFVPGTIFYERHYWESFFSFIWKSLFTGIKESVGVSKEKETKIRKTVKDIGGFISNIKEKLAERKEHNQQKRQERQQKRAIKKEEKQQEKKAADSVKAAEKDSVQSSGK